MGRAFLVARREYLAYITAWGFWVGLLITPVALSLGMFLPSLIENSQPVRYYSVIESGDSFARELDGYMGERDEDIARDLISQQANFDPTFDPDAALAEFERQLEEGLSLIHI